MSLAGSCTYYATGKYICGQDAAAGLNGQHMLEGFAGGAAAQQPQKRAWGVQNTKAGGATGARRREFFDEEPEQLPGMEGFYSATGGATAQQPQRRAWGVQNTKAGGATGARRREFFEGEGWSEQQPGVEGFYNAAGKRTWGVQNTKAAGATGARRREFSDDQ